MGLPLEIHFDEALRLIVWKPRGILDEAAVNEILADLRRRESAAGDNPFNRFTDLTEIESIELTFKYVFHVALYRRLSYAGRPPVKSAFFVTHPQAVHLVKIHATMTDHSPLNVKMFEEREAAAKWLGVPVESLTLPGSIDGTKVP
jgi:hypothetical protein